MTTFTAETRRAQEISGAIQWFTETCCNCHVPFAFTLDHYRELKRSKEYFYCPNGHSQHYTESTEQALRKQLQDEQSARSAAEYRARNATTDRDEALKREQLAAGETRRLSARISAGVCHCCNRYFENVARHMKSKHPGKVHQPFSMTDDERHTLVRSPSGLFSRDIRRRFVAAHAALTDTQIAKLMIDGRLYRTPHLPTVTKMISNLRAAISQPKV